MSEQGTLLTPLRRVINGRCLRNFRLWRRKDSVESLHWHFDVFLLGEIVNTQLVLVLYKRFNDTNDSLQRTESK